MKRFTLLLIVFVLLFAALPVLAQDTPASVDPSKVDSYVALITLVSGLGIGLVVGGGSVLAVVSRVRNDPAILTAIEKLAASWPAETKELLQQISKALEDAAYIIDEAVDGTPVASK